MEPYESLSDEKLPMVDFCPVCKERLFTSADEEDHAWLHIDEKRMDYRFGGRSEN